MCRAHQRQCRTWEMLRLEETVGIVDRMAELPSVENFVCLLQKCRGEKHLSYAKRVVAHICNSGLAVHSAVGNYIVPTFVECGSMVGAQQTFNRLVYPNEHSWTSLILGYIQSGHTQHAFYLHQRMQDDNVHPSTYTLVALLKVCARLKDVERGLQIHSEIAQKGFEREIFVGNTLVSMYAKFGSLAEAQEVFDNLPFKDVVSWNALIAGYAEHGPGREVLKCFDQMQLNGVSPDAVTLFCVLRACSNIGALSKGRQIHREITRQGFERHLFVGNSLVDMYAKCNSLAEARKAFDKLPVRDVVSWATLIFGYAEHGPGEEALKCFQQMQLEGIFPDATTYVCILKACGSIKAISKGREMHAEVAQKGFERELLIGSILVDLYAKCGSPSEAHEVFDTMPLRNVVLWNTLIAAYTEHGPGQEALECLGQMQIEGISPDAVTFGCVLKACGSIEAIGKGREVHAEVVYKGLERDPFLGSTLLGMYANCGSLAEAREVFDKLSIRDVVLWAVLIAGYAEHGPWQEALYCFEQMQSEGLSPDGVTFACLLKACSSIGAKEKGLEVHAETIHKAFELDIFVGNALVDMYATCGSLSDARAVFDKLLARDVVSWNAMIKGYGMNHEGDMAVQSFEDMQKQGMKPNAITFTCLLAACSHTNLLLKGQEFFRVMRQVYGIAPTIDHYYCIVDLLARSGYLYGAEKFLETMQCAASEGIWTSLLSACKTYGEVELGLRCFQRLVEMKSESAASYVLLANTYASSGQWDDAYRIEDLRKQVGAKKKPAYALIEVSKKVHEFVVGDSQSMEIVAMIETFSLRIKGYGHVPNLQQVLREFS